MLTIAFPNINPVLVEIGPLKVHWYGIAYVLAIFINWYIAIKLVKKYQLKVTDKNLEDFLLWIALGIIIGGRLAYVVFYEPNKFLANPIDILKTYEGGMSFHGGLIGVIISTYLFCRKHKIYFWNLIDIITVGAPAGLLFGRLANFINAELYGRITDMPWGIIFPGTYLPRHPSQLYEAFMEGIVLLIIMLFATLKFNTLKKSSINSAIFLIFYSLFRILIEFFREPDLNIGFIYGWITMGQLLSFPLLILGVYLLINSNNTSNK